MTTPEFEQGQKDAPGLIAMLWALVPGASNDRDYDDYEEKGDEQQTQERK